MAKELNLFEEEVETLREEVQSDEEIVHILDRIKEKNQAKEEHDVHWKECRKVIEALLFASHEPINLRRIREVVDSIHPYKPRHILAMIQELREEYVSQDRAFRIDEIAQGYVVRTRPEYGKHVNLLYRNKRLEKLSPAATEVLAIVAYRQPMTRAQVERIRGVDSTGIIQTLLERELIEVTGRLEAPGRPSLLSVTQKFLQYFGLNDLNQLPPVEGLAQAAT